MMFEDILLGAAIITFISLLGRLLYLLVFQEERSKQC